MTFAIASIPIIVAMIARVATIPLFSMLAIAVLMLTIPRRVHVVVPAVLNEVDRSSTRIVFTAMFVPVFRVTWRYTQIKRWPGLFGQNSVFDKWIVLPLGLSLRGFLSYCLILVSSPLVYSMQSLTPQAAEVLGFWVRRENSTA